MSKNDLHIFLLFLILCHFCFSSFIEKAWFDVIPENYDNYSPPILNGKPVIVYLNLEIMDVDEIREKTMDFTMHLYQNEYWKDHRLNLQLLNLTATKVLNPTAAKSIWLPDLVYDNSKWGQLFQFSIPNTVVRINTDLTIQRSSRYSFRVECPMKLQNYPIDIQQCVFKIGYLANTAEKALLEWSGAKNSPYKKYGSSIILTQPIEPLKYEMKMPKPHKVIETWVTGNYSFLFANFTFVRRLTGSIINVYVPSTLVVILSWLSFWLNVNAVPARITLGVTSILTLITQVLQSRSYTPPVNYIKALDIWLFACTFMVTASLIEYAFAHQFTQLREKTNSSSSNVTENWAEKSGNLKCNIVESDKKVKNSSWNIFRSEKSINGFDYCSRFIFPVLFVTFALCYWWYYLRKRLLLTTSSEEQV